MPGKRAEPKPEELEFIFECLVRNRSDKQIVDDLVDAGFPFERSRGFISKRRTEFEIAKKVIDKQVEGAYNPDEIERQKRHMTRLSERAQEILSYLKGYFPYVDDRKIADCLIDEDDFETASLLTDYRSSCLLSHLKNECPQLSGLKSWDDLVVNCIKEWGLINILGSKEDKGIFQGNCDVCEDWE